MSKTGEQARLHELVEAERIESEYLYGRHARTIPAHIKARAAAEWAAMDADGRLPEGFTFPARVEFELEAG